MDVGDVLYYDLGSQEDKRIPLSVGKYVLFAKAQFDQKPTAALVTAGILRLEHGDPSRLLDETIVNLGRRSPEQEPTGASAVVEAALEADQPTTLWFRAITDATTVRRARLIVLEVNEIVHGE
jgi:hypothetical protein